MSNWIDQLPAAAQAYLQKFYIELGFETVSEPYDEDRIPHIRMQLNP